MKKRSPELREFNASVAQLIRECRQERGMSQSELAKAVNLNQAQVSRMESGKHNDFNLSTLFMLFDVMDLGLELRIYEQEEDDGD